MCQEGLSRHPYLLLRIALANFKSVSNEEIAFKPLSVIVGANSSGKSTLLQAVASTIQTIKSEADPGFFSLNGELLRLGNYDDIRNFWQEDSKDSIMIGFRLRLSRSANGEVGGLKMPDNSRHYSFDMSTYITDNHTGDTGMARIEAGSIILSGDSGHQEGLIWLPFKGKELDQETITSLIESEKNSGHDLCQG